MEKLKELRDLTGAGMVDCKKALEEANDDIAAAVEILRKKGIAKAAKRGDREAMEGLVLVGTDAAATEGYVMEINAETDFVARSDRFRQFANDVFALLKERKPASSEELLKLDFNGQTVGEALDSLSGVIGEKLGIKRCAVLKSAGGTVAAYSHLEGRIGVLVSLDQPERGELAKDLAMQVAAANPGFIRPEDVPAELVEKEKEIYRAQLAKEGKPAEIAEKIVSGKLEKYYQDVCLACQEYIKDDKKKISDLLGGATITGFIRFSL